MFLRNILCRRTLQSISWTNWTIKENRCFSNNGTKSQTSLLNLCNQTKVLSCCEQENFYFIQKRFKYNKKESKLDEEQENEDEQDDEMTDTDLDSKIIKIKVGSLRTDLIIKSGLGMARNKVEAAFYDNRIRLNGKKLLKKSNSVKIGDELDLIKGLSTFNPENIVVSRIEIISASAEAEHISITLKRFKSFTIENYSGEHMWKPRSQPVD